MAGLPPMGLGVLPRLSQVLAAPGDPVLLACQRHPPPLSQVTRASPWVTGGGVLEGHPPCGRQGLDLESV